MLYGENICLNLILCQGIINCHFEKEHFYIWVLKEQSENYKKENWWIYLSYKSNHLLESMLKNSSSSFDLQCMYLMIQGDIYWRIKNATLTNILVKNKNSNLKLQDRCQGLQLSMQSVPITTKVVSLNPVCGKVYSIQHYVIKIASDLRQVGGFLWFPPPIKLITTI